MVAPIQQIGKVRRMRQDSRGVSAVYGERGCGVDDAVPERGIVGDALLPVLMNGFLIVIGELPNGALRNKAAGCALITAVVRKRVQFADLSFR